MSKAAAIILGLVLFLSQPDSVLAATVKLNEFASQTAGTIADPDWVEVYYSGVDPSLYRLVDAAGNTKDLLAGTCSTNFCTVDWSNRLNNDGDTIKLVLISAPDSTLDQVIYGSSGDVTVPSAGQSAGRVTDGTGGWSVFSASTKGTTNNSSTPVPTPTPTSAPTPTPTSTPTPKATSTPTPTPKVSSTAGSATSGPTPTPTPAKKPTSPSAANQTQKEELVLGEQTNSPTPTPQQEATGSAMVLAGVKTAVLAGVFIVAGLVLVGFAGYSFLKKGQSGKIDDREDF